MGANPLAVSALGRIVAPGNSHTHTVKIVDGATGIDVPGGSALVVTAGGVTGSFAYANLANPITLNAGSSYYVLSQENSGLDAWYDYNSTTIQTTADATATFGRLQAAERLTPSSARRAKLTGRSIFNTRSALRLRHLHLLRPSLLRIRSAPRSRPARRRRLA